MSTRFIAVAVAVAGFLVPTAIAGAKTYEVTRSGDPAPGACKPRDCSLREAVLAANARGGRDRIALPGRRRAYALTRANAGPAGEDGALEGDLDVRGGLEITHPGRGSAKIDQRAADRVLDAFARLALERVVVTGGDGTTDALDGGGIRSTGRLRLDRARVQRNTADDGGGIELLGGGTLRATRSAFAHNVAADDAGAVDARDPDTGVHLSQSTLERNEAGDDGGGIFAGGSQVRATNTTLYGNRAAGEGGAIVATGPSEVNLNAVTVVRNVADSDGQPPAAQGGGLAHSGRLFRVRNSVVALNRLGDGTGSDCTGNIFASGGFNLISTLGPEGACQGFGPPSDRIRSKPGLARIRDYGGPTRTVALRRGSPAIGLAHAPSTPNRDQRNRRRDGDPDAGAFERGA